jgi:light-regulated signal transduction histidine kinase (bacteriophytochrome)
MAAWGKTSGLSSMTAFERLDPSGSFEDTGIGLAMVRKAAERMGGMSGLESSGTHGSTFWIGLPTAPEPQDCQKTGQNSSVFGKSSSTLS